MPDRSTRARDADEPDLPVAIAMAFDYGERRIGVAVGQMITGTATPLATVERRAGALDWTALAALVQTWRPDALVVGRPSGDYWGAQEIRAAIITFTTELKARFARPIYVVDEAYSSVEAYARLKVGRRARANNKRIDKGEIDRMSAAILLEAWMSGMRGTLGQRSK
ncbi:MAG: Holliday junction resolvase RuvX [Pseudomonadota bacterium]|jgi:putative pre-16S rRNA nuclease|nr:Holliday junction resolvase RuvX [Pseudomonadota bacterium]